MEAESVRTRDDLAAYLAELAGKARGGEVAVENADSVAFLEAASAWVADMDGYFLNRGEPVPQHPSWSLVAMIVSAGLAYE
jgi:hypothetical protein